MYENVIFCIINIHQLKTTNPHKHLRLLWLTVLEVSVHDRLDLLLWACGEAAYPGEVHAGAKLITS
jgi:hypothetical protein